MARGKRVNLKRDIGVDLRFKSELVQKFINVSMVSGKKNTARSMVYKAIDLLAKKMNVSEEKALDVFVKAFENIAPHVEVRSRRVGGSVYQVPREVRPERKRALAIRWLLAAAKNRSNKTMSERLASELFDAYDNRGNAVKKKTDVHKMAESNRAFSHYAW